MEKIAVGIIGAGYWGPNLVRNFSSCPATQVLAVCDQNPTRLEAIGKTNSQMKLVPSVDDLLSFPIQAVAIATPVSTHFALASRCLQAGMHVMVEKPLSATAAEAEALVDIAARARRTLMVDHTYLFSNSIRLMKQVLDSGELGELYYIDSIRINLGLFHRDVNVIWDLAPHDLAIMDYLLGTTARSISAWGCAHADPAIEDIAYVNVDLGDRLMANFHLNWLSPVKVRQMILAGSRKSLIFNELNSVEPVKIYDSGIDVGENLEERTRLMVNYRTGDVRSPHVDPGEPLQAAVRHFAQCICEGQTPLSDGAMGLRVVRLLEAATRSVKAQGGRVVLSNGASINAHVHLRDEQPPGILQGCAGRDSRKQREDPRVREPVRVPDRR